MNKKKWIKYSIITISSIIGLMIILLTSAAIYLNGHKSKIIELAKTKIKESTRGEVEIGSLDVNIFRRFPHLDIEIKDFKLSDTLYHQPLIELKSASTGINIISAIFGGINISKLYLDGGQLHLLTDKNGYSNSYLLEGSGKDKTTKKSDDDADLPNIDVKNLSFKNIQFDLIDQTRDEHLGVHINAMHSELQKSGKTYIIELSQDLLVNGLGFKMSNGMFLKNIPLKVTWQNMKYDIAKKLLSFDPSEVALNDTIYHIGGYFNFSADSATSHMHLDVKASSTTFHHAGSLLAQNIQTKLHQFIWTGPIAVEAHLDGSLKQSTPSIQAKVIANNTELKLAEADVKLNKCSFIGLYNNQQIQPNKLPDDTNSVITLKNFEASWSGIEFKGKEIVAKDLINTRLSASLHGKALLTQLNEPLNLDNFKLTGGDADLTIGYHGKVENVTQVIESFDGKLVVRGGSGLYLPRHFTFNNCDGTIVFGSNDLQVQNLGFELNKNKFLVNVVGKDLMVKNQSSIDCNVHTTGLNLGDFLAIFNPSTSSKKKVPHRAALSKNTLPVDNILTNGKMNLNLTADNVQYQNFNGRNLIASINFNNNYWTLNKLSISHAGGYLSLTGKVVQNGNRNDASLNVNMQNMDISQTLYAFNNFGMNGIGYKNLKGKINLTGNLNTVISNAGSLVPRSSVGKFQFQLSNGVLLNYAPLLKVQKYVFKNRNLNNVQFATINSPLSIDHGNIYIPRIQIASTAIRLFVEGVYSPTGNTDIGIQVPFKSLVSGAPKDEALEKLSADKVGTSIYLKATSQNGGPVSIKLDPSRFFKKDKVGQFIGKIFGADADGDEEK